MNRNKFQIIFASFFIVYIIAMMTFENKFETIIWNYFKKNNVIFIITGVIILSLMGSEFKKVFKMF